MPAISPARNRPPLFFFNDTATTEIYTLSLHDALPICRLIDAADPLRTRIDDQIRLRLARIPAAGAVHPGRRRLAIRQMHFPLDPCLAVGDLAHLRDDEIGRAHV